MSRDKYGTLVVKRGDEIVIAIDKMTAEWLLDILISFGEHIAAGARIEPLPADANNRMSSFLGQLTEVVLANRRSGGPSA